MTEKRNENLDDNSRAPINPEDVIHQLIKGTVQLKPLELNFSEEDNKGNSR